MVYLFRKEIFEEHPILSKFKESENIALTLHFVQPQEYIEVFRGLKFSPDVEIGQKGVLCKGL